MRVRVDQSRQHGGVREIDHLRTGGNLRIRANTRYLVAMDDNGLVGERLAGLHVKQVSRSDNNRLR